MSKSHSLLSFEAVEDFFIKLSSILLNLINVIKIVILVDLTDRHLQMFNLTLLSCNHILLSVNYILLFFYLALQLLQLFFKLQTTK